VRLLSDLFFRLSPYLAFILEWNRWANDRGGKDGNKPLDLKIEQINKIIKKILRRLGPNIGEDTVRKLCTVAPYLHAIRVAMREALGLPTLSAPVTALDRTEDVTKLAAYLTTNKVFTATAGRAMRGMSEIPRMWFSAVNRAKFAEWVNKTKTKLSAPAPLSPTPRPTTILYFPNSRNRRSRSNSSSSSSRKKKKTIRMRRKKKTTRMRNGTPMTRERT